MLVSIKYNNFCPTYFKNVRNTQRLHLITDYISVEHSYDLVKDLKDKKLFEID